MWAPNIGGWACSVGIRMAAALQGCYICSNGTATSWTVSLLDLGVYGRLGVRFVVCEVRWMVEVVSW